MAEGQDARVQEIRARLEAATTDVVDELAGFRDFDGEWTANKTHRRRASPGGVRETFYAAGRISGLAEGDSAHADTAYLLARLDALTAERDALLSELTSYRFDFNVSESHPRLRLREPEYFEANGHRYEKTATCRCCDERYAWGWVGDDGICLHCVDGRADIRAERDALTAERDAIQAAWRRDTGLADDAIDHHMARWKKAEAERDALAARLASAEAALFGVALRMDLDDLQGCWCVRPKSGSHEHACVAARAALAGSREQAAGEGE
jgi:hypothetical protein